MEREIALEVWGDFACFCPSYAKVERLTSPVPTPSAARGIYSAIYSKPAEFYWQITRIEVLNPIRYISFKRNEVKSTVNIKTKVEDSILYTDEDRTQRMTQALRDVRYRIVAVSQHIRGQSSSYIVRLYAGFVLAKLFISHH